MRRFLVTLLAVVAGTAVLPAPAHALADGLALTPPMGFNNWNAFGCDVSEQLIKETADLFVSAGLQAAGYEYVNIDDCWSAKERDPDTGRLVPDPAKFPSGIAGLATYVHGKGLKLGIYGDAGTATCAGYPGSLGHEELDAQTFADWGVDYLKYDNCYNQSDGSQADYIRRYTAMRDALKATGRPIVYSICEWGSSQPWTWGADVGHLWRTTGDIHDDWTSLRHIISANAPLYPHAGPGQWNDPDMLEVGNGRMTSTEYRTHMSMWAMMAAPLMIGTDLRKASAETLAILTNADLIGIDQDPLGKQGAVVSDENGLMVLDKPLADGQRAIALYNATDSLATVRVATGSTGLRRAPAYRLQDVWTGAVTQAKTTIEAAVPAHGTVVYKVRPTAGPGVAPSVTAGATIGTVAPDAPATLSSTVTNRGAGAIRDVQVGVTVPDGWTATPTTPASGASLATDATLATTWSVQAPADVEAGAYPLTITAAYTWGGRHRATTESTLVAAVVTPPEPGRRHLSTVPAATTANAVGPVELDQSNGGPPEGDGNLITVGGTVHTRGLGTSAPSEVRYYLGGRCSQLVTGVGVDDQDRTGVSATFTVHADDTAAASATAAPGAAPQTLTADLSGAAWLRLVTTSTAPTFGDWVEPVITCGDAGPDDPVLPAERTLASFEADTEGWTIANPDGGGTVERTTDFATHGTAGLLVHTPVNGNWFGRNLAEPLDLSGATALKFDVRVVDAGSVGEIAVQVGDAWSWCQGGQWTWTNPGASRTVTRTFDELSCPAGVTLDRSRINAVWVFLNTGGAVQIDNLRAEQAG
jgi:alpha-galactosidase